MKVVVISFSEPEFIPDLFEPLIKSEHEVLAIIEVPPLNKSSSLVSFVKTQLLLYGLYSFTKKAASYSFKKFLADNGLSARSLKGLSKKYGIKYLKTSGVNTKETQKALVEIKPEAVIAQVPEKVKASIIKIPKLGFINKHASLLPKYRGLYPVFWALLGKEKNLGYTFHFMNEEFDKGKIIFQEKIDIGKSESVEEIYKRIFLLSGERLPKILKNLKKARSVKKNIATDYYSTPSLKDIKKFKKLKHKYI